MTTMKTAILVVGLAMILAASLETTTTAQQQNSPVRLDNDDIGGVVTSTTGPEAGVVGVRDVRPRREPSVSPCGGSS